MLHSYEQQLLAARRLARFRVRRRMAEGLDPLDPDPTIKRHEFVEKVAQEMYEMLIFTGSENPVVEEIRQELSRLVGKEVQFTYPPGARLCIVGLGPTGPMPLTADEQRRTRSALWRIIKMKVDQGMIEKPQSKGIKPYKSEGEI